MYSKSIIAAPAAALMGAAPLTTLRLDFGGTPAQVRKRCKRKFSRTGADKKFKAQCIARRANRVAK